MIPEEYKLLQELQGLNIYELLSELRSRINMYEDKKDETNLRAIELEQACYSLLKQQKPTLETYQSVEARLRPIREQLRNPALYDLACKRAGLDKHE